MKSKYQLALKILYVKKPSNLIGWEIFGATTQKLDFPKHMVFIESKKTMSYSRAKNVHQRSRLLLTL